jgi:hypothetical protein
MDASGRDDDVGPLTHSSADYHGDDLRWCNGW